MKKTLCSFLLLLSGITLNAQISNTSLVAYWPFNGNANDYSGNANHGTVTGATLTADRFGNPNKAYSFDGISSKIVVPTNTLVDMTNSTDFSISFWEMTYSSPNSNASMINKNAYGLQSGYIFFSNNTNGGYCTTTGQLSFYAAASNAGDACANNAIATGTNLNTWFFIVGVYDAASATASLYVNGVLQSDIGSRYGNLSTPSTDLTIGAAPSGGNYFKGALDDIRIYKRKLSSTDISALYNECIAAAPVTPANTTGPANQIACSGNSTTLTASGSLLINWYASATSTTVLNNSPTFVTPTLSVGTGTFYMEDGSCTFTSTPTRVAVNVTVNASPTISIPDGSLCAGQSFTLQPSGAGSFTFSGGSQVVAPGISTNYTVSTSANGCTNSAISHVTVIALPTLSINSGSVCAGQSYTLNPSGASGYTFSSGSAVVSPLASSDYTINGDLSGCTSSIVAHVTLVPLPVLSISSGSICAGQNFTLQPSGAGSYTFSGGSAVVSPSVSSDYTVNGTMNGCTSSIVAHVTLVPLPALSVGSGSICAGQSFTLQPSGANNYTFSSGSAVVSPAFSSDYTVSGEAIGCINSAVAHLTVVSLPTLSINNGSICAGQSFTLQPSGASSYTFSSGNAVVSPSSSSDYTVNGSTNGCTSSIVAHVTLVPLPTLSVNSGSICAGQSFTLQPLGAGSYTFPGGSAVISPTSSSNYTVNGETSGCMNSVVAHVTVVPLPALSVNSGSICAGQSFTLQPSGAGSYTFSGGSGIVTPISSSDYTISGAVNGCSNSAVSHVTVNPVPAISVNSGSICAGQIFTISPSGAFSYSVTGGSFTVSPQGTASYSVYGTSQAGCTSTQAAISTVTSVTVTISVAGGTICTGNSFSISPSGAANYSVTGGSLNVSPVATTNYTIIGSDPLGCTDTEVITVVVNPLPTVLINGNSFVCSGSPLSLLASGSAVTYSWSTGTIGNLLTVTPGISTTYTLTGEANNCFSTAVFPVTVYPLPTITVNSGTLCEGSSYLLSPAGAQTYSYSGGSAQVSPSVTSTYTVTGTDASGCRGTGIATLTVFPAPILLAVSDHTQLCVGETAQLNASGAQAYTWNGSASGSTLLVQPTVTTEYTVTGTDANGCSASVQIEELVSDCLGLNEATADATHFRLFPNPNSGVFTLRVGQAGEMKLMTTLGELLFTQTLITGENRILIEHLPAGIYILSVKVSGENSLVRIIKE